MCVFLISHDSGTCLSSSAIFPEGKALFSQELCAASQKKWNSTNEALKGKVVSCVVGSVYREKGNS